MAIWRAFGAVGKALQVLTVTEGVLQLTDSRRDDEESEELTMSEDNGKRTVFEEIEVEGQQLVERVKALLHEGNIRRLRIKDAQGRYLLEVPLTVGVVAGGVFMMASPVLTALSALAGLVANVKIEIVREVDDDESGDEGEP